MAATITKVNPESNPVKLVGGAGQLRFSVITLAGDASYPAGGYALAASDFGLSTLLAVVVAGQSAGIEGEYDYANGKLKFNWFNYPGAAAAAAAEVTAATNVSTSTFRLVGIGF